MTTKNSTTKRYRIPADHIQNLEIDRTGRVIPRLHDLEPLENTLLSVLYPGIRVASVNVPSEQLDDYEESQVESALAKLRQARNLLRNMNPSCELAVDGGLTLQLQENIGVALGHYMQQHPDTWFPY